MTSSGSERSYQRLLIAAIDAELGIRRWSRAHLAREAGMNRETAGRVFTLKRDLNVTQFGAMADALGLRPDELTARAEALRGRLDLDPNEMITDAKELTESQKRALRDELSAPDPPVTPKGDSQQGTGT